MEPAQSPIPIQALLAHRAWVHRLARTLVRDSARADDVEQETWLRAQTRPPRHAGALKAWLGTVVRRVASDARRAEGRRARREQAAARAERTRSTAEVVGEAEALRRVVGAVLDLDEPYRSTLLLRYFDDLGPEEIASRTGVPLETVRTRLKRGLARLRERLAPELRGEGAAALFLLARRLPPEPAPPAGGVPLSEFLLGAAAMTSTSKTLVAALGVLLLMGGAVVGVRLAADRAPEEGPAAGPPQHEVAASLPLGVPPVLAAPPGPAAASVRRDAAPGLESASASAPRAEPSTVSVEVVDETGARATNGMVHLSPAGLAAAEVLGDAVKDMESFSWLLAARSLEAANPLEITIPPEYAARTFTVKAEVPGFAPVELEFVAAGGETARLSLQVVRGRSVEFEVHSAEEAVGNARVVSLTEFLRRGLQLEKIEARAGIAFATTSVDGRCVITDLGPGEHEVEVLAAGFRPARVAVAPGDVGPVVVRLEAARDEASLEVSVTDPNGTAVPGLRVLVNTRRRLTPLVASTGAEGVARFEGLPAGLQVARLDTEDWGRLSREGRWPQGGAPLLMSHMDVDAGATGRLALGYPRATAVVVCEVVDHAGTAVAGVGVTLFGPSIRKAATDASGRARFQDVVAGTYHTHVARRDKWFDETPIEVKDSATLSVGRTIGDREITGIVRAASGDRRAVAGASVSAASGVSASTTAGTDGTFSLGDVVPGRYRLEATAEGFASGTAEVVVPAEGEAPMCELLLSRGGRVVLEAAPADIARLEGARMRLLAPDHREMTLRIISTGRAFRRTDVLPPGRYVLEVVSADGERSERVVDVPDGADAVIALSDR